MRFSASTFAISVLGVRALAAPNTGLQSRAVGAFVDSERAVALKQALSNIGPDGSRVSGAKAGIVVASPSKTNPNCKSLLELCHLGV